MHNRKPRNTNFNIKLKAFRIALIYFVFGSLWIILSDKIVDELFINSKDIIAASIFKGLFYVLTTAALIYVLIYSSFWKSKQNEEMLHRSQEIANSGSWEIKAGSNMLLVSDNFLSLLDLETNTNFISMEDLEGMIHEHERGLFHEALAGLLAGKEKKVEIQHRIKPRGGEEFYWVHCIAENEYNKSGKVTKVYGVIMDITQTKRLEEEKNLLMEQAWSQQKLESIGTLASGIAHEINNPINGILNYGQLILDTSEQDSEIKKYAGDIIDESERISKIVANLLDFSRQTESQPSYERIEDIISKTISLVNANFKHDGITLNVDIDESTPDLKCVDRRIQQVLLNLLTNARDSLNEKYPGYHENKKIELKCHGLIKDNMRSITVSVKDFGMGISGEVSPYIFDPFYTTKDISKGTGLGLSISHGIVREHDGELTFETQKGEYTRFTMTLPY
ncbi:MAG: PAS domain-containing protein [Clostridia bacterium]|nr:PAS domain-containing protein [Clostridia bacterium]